MENIKCIWLLSRMVVEEFYARLSLMPMDNAQCFVLSLFITSSTMKILYKIASYPSKVLKGGRFFLNKLNV
ncbi:hypothetical protein C6H69_00270 [Photorhabdus luminescens]|nr:hypothetical protein C6H69_00270 [Photorhabdus luminescens]